MSGGSYDYIYSRIEYYEFIVRKSYDKTVKEAEK